MRELIIEATIEALGAVRHPRFFNSERGYQGRFYCALQSALDKRGILTDGYILEIEYQKTKCVHQTRQRPDIILHIPREVIGAQPEENNLAVWALKYKASIEGVKDDFRKLNEMFEILHYPLGFFINTSSQTHCLELYEGPYWERIITFSVWMSENNLNVNQAIYQNGVIHEIGYRF